MIDSRRRTMTTIKNNTIRITKPLFVEPKMIHSIYEQHKIFDSVVIFDFINMMHNFFSSKISTHSFFHYKSMFENMMLFRWKRMLGFVDKNISFTCISTSFPHRVIRTNILAFLKFCCYGIMFTFLKFSVTSNGTKFAFVRWAIIKSFAAGFAFNHCGLHIKRLCSACLEVTVRLLTHTKRRLLAIRNPSPLSNYSITDLNLMST